ncbi:MAG: SUMF1/EgtB/PvdO family nonheme iron enzyme [Fibrobacterota bacterium]
MEIRTSEISATQIHLEWSPKTTDGFLWYELHTKDSAAPQLRRYNAQDTTLLITGLQPDTSYEFTLSLLHSGGRITGPSLEVHTLPLNTDTEIEDISKGSMVLIPAGNFWWYSRTTAYDTTESGEIIGRVVSDSTAVEIGRSFYMDTTVVDAALWNRIMDDTLSGADEGLPARRLSWFSAILFCNKRSIEDGFDTAYTYDSISYGQATGTIQNIINLSCDFSSAGYRLPTEDEWTYALRAGTGPGFFWGESWYPHEDRTYPHPDRPQERDSIDKYICWEQDSPCPVASKQPNPWGLYDMAGTINEFVWNVFYEEEELTNRKDYRGPDLSLFHPLEHRYRGGAYNEERMQYMVDWFRGGEVRANLQPHAETIGFRTVRSSNE